MPIPICSLPGPKALPLIGNVHQLKQKKLPEILGSWADEFGTPYRFQIMGRTFAAFSRLDSILKVLRERPGHFRRLANIEAVFRELGTNGLFSTEGDEWRRQRALTNPAFNSGNLQNFYGTLSLVVQRLLSQWNRLAVNKPDVEVQKDLMKFTVDVTTSLAFGSDLNTLERDEDVTQKHLEKIFPLLANRITAPIPYWRYFRLPKDRRAENALNEVMKTVDSFMATGRARIAANPSLKERPTNFLEGLLSVPDMTDDEIRGNLLTILLAGEDTTANSLAWMLHLLVEHPEVQKKMQAEADEVLGEAVFPVSYADCASLRYTEAVAMETLRTRSVAQMLFLEALVDTEVEGVTIPKGTNLVTLLSHCGMQEENFSSAKEFNPDRWLNPKGNHNPKAMLSFGDGPRFCPGRSLALLEMKAVGAMIARNFHLSKPSNGAVPRATYQFVVVPENLWLRIEKRPQKQ